MQTVHVTQDFPQPVEEVFAYLAEHEHLEPVFGTKVRRINDGTDGSRNGTGSAREMRVGPLPPFVETHVEVVPNELIRYRITKGGILKDHEGVLRFTSRTFQDFGKSAATVMRPSGIAGYRAPTSSQASEKFQKESAIKRG